MNDNRLKKIQKQLESYPISTYKETLSFYTSLIQRKKDYYGVHNSNSAKKKNLYFADGAIGSGKSTIFKNYIILNGIEDLLYYNPEYYVNSFNHNKDFLSQYNDAKNFLWKDMQNRILTGESFIVESVFTKDSKLNFLKKAKDIGYNLHGIYVGTSNSDINIERIQERVKQGSHTIPKDKIIDRYNKSYEKLKTVYEISDTFMMFDNSSNKPILIIYKIANNRLISEGSLPLWVDNFFKLFSIRI